MDRVLVFSQKSLSVQALVQQGTTHFDARLKFADEPGDQGWLEVRLEGPAEYAGLFRLRERAASVDDQQGLDAAECANKSFGMADLARRCGHVWELEVVPGTSPAASYYMAALLASVALGPLLPADGSGLYGVRSCRVRAQKLLAEDP